MATLLGEQTKGSKFHLIRIPHTCNKMKHLDGVVLCAEGFNKRLPFHLSPFFGTSLPVNKFRAADF